MLVGVRFESADGLCPREGQVDLEDFLLALLSVSCFDFLLVQFLCIEILNAFNHCLCLLLFWLALHLLLSFSFGLNQVGLRVEFLINNSPGSISVGEFVIFDNVFVELDQFDIIDKLMLRRQASLRELVDGVYLSKWINNLEFVTNAHDHVLLFGQNTVDHFDLIRNVYGLVSNKSALKVLLIASFHFHSLVLLVFRFECFEFAVKHVLLQIKCFIC